MSPIKKQFYQKLDRKSCYNELYKMPFYIYTVFSVTVCIILHDLDD